MLSSRLVKHKSSVLGAFYRSFFPSRFIKRALHHSVAPVNHFRAAKFRQLHHFFLSRLKSHRCPGRNIQPHAVSRSAVETQRAIHLKKVVVTSDLHRPVAGVSHDDARDPSSRICCYGASRFIQKVFARLHVTCFLLARSTASAIQRDARVVESSSFGRPVHRLATTGCFIESGRESSPAWYRPEMLLPPALHESFPVRLPSPAPATESWRQSS